VLEDSNLGVIMDILALCVAAEGAGADVENVVASLDARLVDLEVFAARMADAD
jgi:hypothetical protein